MLNYTYIALLVSTEESVYCAVRAEALNIYQVHLRPYRVKINVRKEIYTVGHYVILKNNALK
jgi:hypothetical protein